MSAHPFPARVKVLLALGAGAAVVLAFIPFHVAPLILLYPVFLNLLTIDGEKPGRVFLLGFLASLVVNLGGFWWIIYTIHIFGYLPYWIATLIFLIFCGFGALNVPLFAASAAWLHRRVHLRTQRPVLLALWFTLGLPAGFVVLEFLVPKLFPFYFGHALYWLPWLTQICEVAGSQILTFAVMSAGGALTLAWLGRYRHWRVHPLAVAVPVCLWTVIVGFGVYRLSQTPGPEKILRVALIQANIGSLEKVAARGGLRSKIRHTMDEYFALTDSVMAREPKPDLVVWPETAMPFELARDGLYQQEVRDRVMLWGKPLITGAYAKSPQDPRRDTNAAYLLTPDGATVSQQIYHKNILLAFGEYFPGGEAFPALYRLFPAVSDFARGREYAVFTLPDGTRLGITICYEAIVPDFFRGAVKPGVQAVVNLTNDSWFGPTTEPLHHGALASFRSPELRVPLIRVTNTGMSFVVDDKGRMGETTAVYEPGVLVKDVRIPAEAPRTIYLRWGNWLVWLSAGLATALGLMLARRKNASLPS